MFRCSTNYLADMGDRRRDKAYRRKNEGMANAPANVGEDVARRSAALIVGSQVLTPKRWRVGRIAP